MATERVKLERKILWKLQDELEYIGVKCEGIELTVTASKVQPFVQPANQGDIGGISGQIEKMNSKSSLLQDMFAGMAGHPGFANIVASVAQQGCSCELLYSRVKRVSTRLPITKNLIFCLKSCLS